MLCLVATGGCASTPAGKSAPPAPLRQDAAADPDIRIRPGDDRARDGAHVFGQPAAGNAAAERRAFEAEKHEKGARKRDDPDRGRAGLADKRPQDEAAKTPSAEPEPAPEVTPAPEPKPEPPAEPKRPGLAEDPHRKVPHASELEPAPAGSPRVRLPSAGPTARATLPDTFRVAVALVRDGRLSSDEKGFLSIARAIELERRVKGVIRVRVEADETDAKGLADAAAREGARVLVIDVASDSPGVTPLVLVCDVPSGAVLARLEGQAAKDAREPAASDVAGLLAMRTVRR